MIRERAPRNRTLTLGEREAVALHERLLVLEGNAGVSKIENRLIHQDIFTAAPLLPRAFVDLLIVDPPYNLTKSFNGKTFTRTATDEYAAWIESWLKLLIPTLKPAASLYFCGDWRSCASVQLVLEKYFVIRNRITWEREKGRGALSNWKNCSEDIWFCTVGDDYHFDAGAVKLKRKVIAPYTDAHGQPKDWQRTDAGDFRLTHPSNLWTDLTVPFWSMPENTDHPTQKPEKLLAKLILASSRPGDFVFDPFLGSGTTAVVAKKLGRRFCGVESDLEYCCLAEKRLAAAEGDHTIQGYTDGVFWERNTTSAARRGRTSDRDDLFFAP